MLDLMDYENFAPVLLYDLARWKEAVKDCPTQCYKAGEQIRMQGDEDGHVLIVKDGYCVVSVLLDDGTETIQHIAGPGCSFGYIAATSGLPYMSAIRAYTDCECYIIFRERVRYLQENQPDFTQNALMISSMQGDLYFKRISLLAIPQTSLKLLYLILGFAASVGRRKKDGSIVIELELTHQMLSEILQVNRVTISRMMSAFSRQGAVVKQGKYYVLNLEAIEELL